MCVWEFVLYMNDNGKKHYLLPDNVCKVYIHWCHVWIFTIFLLKNHLLNDAINNQPLAGTFAWIVICRKKRLISFDKNNQIQESALSVGQEYANCISWLYICPYGPSFSISPLDDIQCLHRADEFLMVTQHSCVCV